MKRKFFAIMLLAAGLTMTACFNNNQSNNVKPVVDDQKKIEEPQDEVRTGSIGEIKKVWAKKSFAVDPGDHTPNIETYALAFCDTYPMFEVNRVLANYLVNEVYDNDQYEIISDKKNGYIHCMWEVQYSNFTDVCYWNRKDGHQLIAAYMEDSGEGGWFENLVVFYDYDYANDLLTPEPELTQMIENRMKKYDAYSVVLPREGKDIQVIGYIFDEENDTADRNELKLKWDGQTFDWVD